MVVTGQLMNLGEWPPTVAFVIYKGWWFQGKWHLINVMVVDDDWNVFAEWPIWAMTALQEKRMVDVLRTLVPRTLPGKDR